MQWLSNFTYKQWKLFFQMQFHMESQCTKELNAELLWPKGESGSQKPARGSDEPVKNTDVAPPLPLTLSKDTCQSPS